MPQTQIGPDVDGGGGGSSVPVAIPTVIPPAAPPPRSNVLTSGDLYQQLQAQREAKQAQKNVQTVQASLPTAARSALVPLLVIGAAIFGVIYLTRKRK